MTMCLEEVAHFKVDGREDLVTLRLGEIEAKRPPMVGLATLKFAAVPIAKLEDV